MKSRRLVAPFLDADIGEPRARAKRKIIHGQSQ